ncbi:hypothetical protein HY837_02695 [archaeon]|nr:hypothetical protein [archaeon]
MKYYYLFIAGVLLIILLTSVFGFAITAFAVSQVKNPEVPVKNVQPVTKQPPKVNAQSSGPIKIYGTAEEQKKEYKPAGSNQPEAKVVSTEGPKPVSARQRGPVQVDQEALREKQRQREEARMAAEKARCRSSCLEQNDKCKNLCPLGIFSPFVNNCENNCKSEKNACINRCN